MRFKATSIELKKSTSFCFGALLTFPVLDWTILDETSKLKNSPRVRTPGGSPSNTIRTVRSFNVAFYLPGKLSTVGRVIWLAGERLYHWKGWWLNSRIVDTCRELLESNLFISDEPQSADFYSITKLLVSSEI